MTNYSQTNFDQEELDLIADFEQKLENIFFTETKIAVKPPKDGLISIVIEIDSHFSLSEIISLLKMPFDERYRMSDLKKTIYRFKNAVYQLNETLQLTSDIQEFSIYFRDTAITINAVSNSSIMNEIDDVIHSLIRHYKYYSTLIGAIPNAIHIPVFEDPSTKRLFNIENLGDMPSYSSPYAQYWGFYYDFLDKPLIYNLSRTNIMPGDLDISLE